MSVRARLFMYLVGLTTVALTLTGLTAFLIERARIDAAIAEDLTLRAEAFLDLAADVNPTSGQPYVSANALMREAMVRVVATPTVSAVALAGDSARFVPPPSGGRLRLELDREFVQTAGDAVSGADTTIEVRATETAIADYRFVALPVVDPDGDVVGTWVVGADRGAQVSILGQTFRVYSLVAVLAVAVIGAIAWTTVGNALRPVTTLEETTRRISERDLDERIPVVGHDDLARLSRTVNGMLDRLQRAFGDQQRLLDDVSHELRTPLSIMRTHLELLEPRDPDEVSRSQKVLLDEVHTMARLVDDLVLLAMSDRPEFIRVAPIDLTALSQTAFARASALAERDWRLDSAPSVTFQGDAQRLTQAWLQLAANAVKFSASDSIITMGSMVTSDYQVCLWVRDKGIGIEPHDQERVMRRFERVHPDYDGAGLGLTIVTAIAVAHGGTLALESKAGVGSTFTIRIPRDGGHR